MIGILLNELWAVGLVSVCYWMVYYIFMVNEDE